MPFASTASRASPWLVCMVRSSTRWGPRFPLDQSLIVLGVNSDYVDELLRTHRPETVASHLSHVAAKGLVQRWGSPMGCGWSSSLATAGAGAGVGGLDGPTSSLATSPIPPAEPGGRRPGRHGSMALVILDKYATDPDFREILRVHGAGGHPANRSGRRRPGSAYPAPTKERRSFTESLAKLALLASGDNGQAVIRTIKKDGLERVAYLNHGEIQFYQFLPLYDVLHLGNVLRQRPFADLGRDDMGHGGRLLRGG